MCARVIEYAVWLHALSTFRSQPCLAFVRKHTMQNAAHVDNPSKHAQQNDCTHLRGQLKRYLVSLLHTLLVQQNVVNLSFQGVIAIALSWLLCKTRDMTMKQVAIWQ